MTARLTKITVEQTHEGGDSAITIEVRDAQRSHLVLTETVRTDLPIGQAAAQAVTHGNSLATTLNAGMAQYGPPARYGERP